MLLLSIITLKTKLLLRFGWYRAWSDTFIEQGFAPTLTNRTLNFIKSFKNTNYVVNASTCNSGWAEVRTYNFATTSMFTVAAHEGGTYNDTGSF